MKRIILVCLLGFMGLSAWPQNDTKLWYRQPAAVWTEALPLGNGHLGAMVFGRMEEELVQLNESTLWSGGPVKTNVNPDAPRYLQQARDALLKEEDYDKALALTKKIQGLYSQSYLPMGDIIIRQKINSGTPSSYTRDLDIKNAIATTQFSINNVLFKREMFISAADKVMVIRISASKAGQLNLDLSARSQLRTQPSVNGTKELVINGKAPSHVDPSYYNPKGRNPVIYEDFAGCNGMRFQFRIRAESKDGQLQTDTSGIHITNASVVLLYVSAATSFNGFDKCPQKNGKDENRLATDVMENAVKQSWETLFARHLKDYHQYYNRVTFNIQDSSGNNRNALLPSDQRLLAYS